MLRAMFGALPAVLLLAIPLAKAQDASAPQAQVSGYVDWWTNDYNCVINCLQITLDNQVPPVTQAEQDQIKSCVLGQCNSTTADANIYQAIYIMRMFNSTGSIYENQNVLATGGDGDESSSSSSDSSYSSSTDSTDWSAPTDSSDPSTPTDTSAGGTAAQADSTTTPSVNNVAPAGAPTTAAKSGASANASASHSGTGAGTGNGTANGTSGGLGTVRVAGAGMGLPGLAGVALALGLGLGGGVLLGL